MSEQINETTNWLKSRINCTPEAAIILGSGLGQLTESIEDKNEIAYKDIPHFPISTVEGHAGKLITGKLGGKNVVAMSGRFHYYEGYSMKETTFPIRVFHGLGIHTLFASNAAGGTNPSFHIGDLMLITDHINMMPENPLRGKNIAPGPRFPDMTHAYSPELRLKATAIAADLGIRLQEGVYLATQGPTYETPAEYRMFRLLGADAVGMSTVPEIIVANHCGMQCLGISVITNVSQTCSKVSHEEVKSAADAAQPKMTDLFIGIIKSL
ncbi:MAG TPA: purine-nucleoside phosphorylase [Prevotellaceae bacterium]|nr:purine-nucleoside phosphorylase [Prevotellaceae bacterium]